MRADGGAWFAVRSAARSAFALIGLTVIASVPLTLTGCSLFHRDEPPAVEVVAPEPAPDTTAVTVAPPATTVPAAKPKSGSGKKSGSTSRDTTPKPSPAPPPADTLVVLPGAPVPEMADAAHRPVVSAVLTDEQKSAKASQFHTDTGRANQALDSLRGRTLTDSQADQKASAERFLAESRAAFDGNDLPRACSLAEKARVIAEELKSATSPK